jgi:hypothetical protein
VVFSVSVLDDTDLFAVPILGGLPPVHLNGTLQVSPPYLGKPEIDSTGRWVPSCAESPETAQLGLFAASLAGGAPFAVNGRLMGDELRGGAFVPGARAVVYLAEQDDANALELYVFELGTRP